VRININNIDICLNYFIDKYYKISNLGNDNENRNKLV